jgi:L-asparaginase/Glu-tRNA(Gln) amidotransferase subunit D
VTIRELGVVGAGGLTAAKARLLLMVALERAPAGEALSLFREAVQALSPGTLGPD